MVDGGLGVVGNPVYQACVEAFEFSDGKYNPAETQVFSLGTGIAPAPTQPAGDLLSKLKWILDVALEAPKNQQTEMVERHYQPGLAGFHRCDVKLPRAIAEDDVTAVEEMAAYGKQMAIDIDWKKVLNFGKP